MAGLTLDQFWDSTPFELALVLSGFGERIRRQYELAAWHVSYIINLWSKRKVTPARLLRKRGTLDVADFESVEDLNRKILERRMGQA